MNFLEKSENDTWNYWYIKVIGKTCPYAEFYAVGNLIYDVNGDISCDVEINYNNI